jgi:DNA (cytosine-5)-methyltransferase 1
MKILNLYAGIGGNRKLWGNEHEITAVEYDPNIAAIYKDFFPGDEMVIADAHEFLLKNFSKYDFIWASPPCPSHSRSRFWGQPNNPVYPDFKLYEEIVLLTKWFKGKWIVENVIPYYEPLVKPKIELHRHFIWANFDIDIIEFEKLETCRKLNEREFLQGKFNIDISQYKGIDKRKLLRNCVLPEMGLHVFNAAFKKPIVKTNVQLELDVWQGKKEKI